MRNHIVEDCIGVSNLEPCLVSICHTVNKVEDRKFFVAIGLITCGCVNAQRTLDAEGVGMIETIRNFAVRYVLYVLNCWFVGTNVNKAALKTFIWEEFHIVGVVHIRAVNNETIRINVGTVGGNCDAPNSVGILSHCLLTAKKLIQIEFYFLGVVGFEAECYAAVLVIFRRNHRFWEHSRHHAGRKLLVFLGFGECYLHICALVGV